MHDPSRILQTINEVELALGIELSMPWDLRTSRLWKEAEECERAWVIEVVRMHDKAIRFVDASKTDVDDQGRMMASSEAVYEAMNLLSALGSG